MGDIKTFYGYTLNDLKKNWFEWNNYCNYSFPPKQIKLLLAFEGQNENKNFISAKS